jgi:hypothetical protein
MLEWEDRPGIFSNTWYRGTLNGVKLFGICRTGGDALWQLSCELPGVRNRTGTNPQYLKELATRILEAWMVDVGMTYAEKN